MSTPAVSELKLFKCLPVPRGNIKDVHELQSIRMAIIHNVIIRGFNSLLYYSGQVKPETKELQSFLQYSAEICHFVHHHHEIEETQYFPYLESKLGTGTMQGNVGGHEAFKPSFVEFETHVEALRSATPPAFEVQAFREKIYAFAPPLFEHLAEEIDTFRAPVLHKAGMSAADLQKFEKVMEADVMKTVVLSKDPMLLWINGDSVNGAWFPPIPAPVAFVARNILSYKHSNMWGFGACDKHMRVKPQFAAYEPEMEAEAKDAGKASAPTITTTA